MKFNKEKLDAIASLPDNKMWEEIRKIASERGFKLPDTAPPRETMEKIRSAIAGAEKLSLADAAKIMQSYKRKGG